MKVLQLTTKSEATYITNQVEALRELGVESDVLEVPNGSTTGGRSPIDYLRFCPHVRNQLRGGGYDLVHANFGLTIPAALAQRHVPVVTSLVGTDLMGQFGFVTKGFARFCDEIIVVSPHMDEMLSADTTVIPYGIDFDQFHPIERETARNEVGWETDGYHVLFPYSPDRSVKNYPLADRVVARTESRLDAEIELHTITGTDYSRMPYYMNAADALLLTSHREGSPATVKEALACNTPVIGTAVGDLPQQLSELELSGSGDSLEELVDLLARTVLADRRELSRDAIWDLRMEQMGKRILDVYNRALDNQPATWPLLHRTRQRSLGARN